MFSSSRKHSGGEASGAESFEPYDRPNDGATDAPGHGEDTVDETAELIARLTNERDDAIAARQRALADFRNFQRRADEAEIRAVTSGTARAVKALIPALDHFDLALSQDMTRMTVEQLAEGVRMVRKEIDKTLESLGVTRIEPARGEEFDPTRHEAMLRQPVEGLEENTVVSTLQPGFVLGDLLLRPAKVVLAGPPAST